MRLLICILTLAGFSAGELTAADKKPLRALLITGGCCHDYATQKDLLKSGLEARLNIVVDHAHSPDKSTNPPLAIYGNANYANGYDVVIHDECAAAQTDPKVIAGAANAKWYEYIGLQSTGHGPKKPIAIAFEHNVPFITKGINDWTTGNEELYNNVQVFPGTKVVARGTQGKSKAVVAWTNVYHGTRVFSTSLGHNNFTVADPRYLDFVARGLLWAVKREDAPIKKADK